LGTVYGPKRPGDRRDGSDRSGGRRTTCWKPRRLKPQAILGLNVGSEEGAIVGIVRLEIRLWNIAVSIASLLLLATLVGYLFVENFVYRS